MTKFVYFCKHIFTIPMTKTNYELTLMQRDDLMAAYRAVYRNCWTQKEAWKKTAEHPAPRYYVTAKEAYEKLRRMVRGDMSVVDRMGKSKRRMYYSLYKTLIRLTEKREYSTQSLWFLCPILVSQPAPEFFMEPRTVKDIYIKYKHHGRNFRHKDVYKKRHEGESRADNT